MQTEGSIRMVGNRITERRRKRKEKRKKSLIFTGCGMLISVVFLCVLLMTGQFGIRTIRGVTSVEQYNLIEAEEIEQEIEIKYSYLDSIYLFFVNLEEGQEGDISLELIDENGKRVLLKDFPLDKIEIGRFQKLPVRKFMKKGSYTLTVNYSGDIPEYGVPKIMVLGEEKNLEETGKCYFKGQAQEEALAIGYEYYQFPHWLWLAIAAIIPLLAFLASD